MVCDAELMIACLFWISWVYGFCVLVCLLGFAYVSGVASGLPGFTRFVGFRILWVSGLLLDSGVVGLGC